MKHLQWRVPSSHTTLRKAVESIREFADSTTSPPWIVRLIEHPSYGWFNGTLFPGACTMDVHDIIHCILDQDLSPRGEAVVIGYTMGSTRRMTDFKNMLYRMVSRFLYPTNYRFTATETIVYGKVLMLGEITCMYDLSRLDYTELMDDTLDVVRRKLGIELIHLQNL